eukprot:COSAG02_NODE_6402_length_3598_cov_12.565019_2_plen_112_part_00
MPYLVVLTARKTRQPSATSTLPHSALSTYPLNPPQAGLQQDLQRIPQQPVLCAAVSSSTLAFSVTNGAAAFNKRHRGAPRRLSTLIRDPSDPSSLNGAAPHQHYSMENTVC